MNSPEMDKMIEDARSSTDPAVRAELYKEIQTTVQDGKWWVPVLYYVDCWSGKAGIDFASVLKPTGYHEWWKVTANQ